ncbi:hypothetical protein ACP70R_047136 [Stipagrostis hirtigluma subsp. patula]
MRETCAIMLHEISKALSLKAYKPTTTAVSYPVTKD